MILTENLTIGGKEYIRHYTDTPIYDEDGNELPKLIQVETGYEFIDAVDTVPCRYTYIEKEECHGCCSWNDKWEERQECNHGRGKEKAAQ